MSHLPHDASRLQAELAQLRAALRTVEAPVIDEAALRAQFRDAERKQARIAPAERAGGSRRLPLAAAAAVVLAVGGALTVVVLRGERPAPVPVAAEAPARRGRRRISAAAELAGSVGVGVVQRRARAHSAVGVRGGAGDGAGRNDRGRFARGRGWPRPRHSFQRGGRVARVRRRSMIWRIAMSSKHILATLVSGLCAATAIAQTRRAATATAARTRCSSSGTLRRCAVMGGRIDFIRSEGGVPGPVVEGKPYSARSITESTQMLADGNRIAQRNEAVIYRDSEGRTRREQTLTGIGQWQVGEPVTMINIHDPVAGKSYVLDPARENRARDSAVPDGDRPRSAEIARRRTAGATGTWSVAVPAPPPVPPPAGGVVAVDVERGVERDVTVIRRTRGRPRGRASFLHGARRGRPVVPSGHDRYVRARRGARRASARRAARERHAHDGHDSGRHDRQRTRRSTS